MALIPVPGFRGRFLVKGTVLTGAIGAIAILVIEAL